MKNKHTPYATLLIVFTIIYAAAFYMLSAQTQFYIYDYCYVFRHAPDHLKHIPGYEAFSFYTDHFAGVSRFVPHLLVWAAHHIGKGLFAVAATASFLLLAVLIVRAGCPVRGRLLPLSVLSAALMWFVMPGFFEGFLWMSGACNYLFPAVLTIAFYILFSRDSHNTISSYDYIFLPLLWLFGFIAGWTNEGFVVGMAAGCILFFIVRRDLITRRRIALLCGYICGAIPLCLSPLNTARLFDSHKDCTGLYDHIHAFAVSVYSMTNAPLSITLAILAVAAVAATGRHRALGAMRRFAAKHIIILTAWLVSALFIIITRYTSDYSRIPTELYATVLLIAAASRLNARTLGALSLPAAIVLTIAAMYTLPADAGNARTYACLRGSIARGERVICCRPYSLNRFERRYIVPLSTRCSSS